MNRRNGFTLVELMVVILIIAILIGLITWGLGGFGDQGKIKDTHQRMNTLRIMLETLRSTDPQLRTIAAIPYPGSNNNPPILALPTTKISVDFAEDPNQRYPDVQDPTVATNAVRYSQLIIGRLRAVPANRTTLQNMPTQSFLKHPQGHENPPQTYDPPVVVDGWNNPIIYVPKEGLSGVVLYAKNPPQSILVRSPNNLPFFASAGPDGLMSTGDDNVYSFEN